MGYSEVRLLEVGISRTMTHDWQSPEELVPTC